MSDDRDILLEVDITLRRNGQPVRSQDTIRIHFPPERIARFNTPYPGSDPDAEAMAYLVLAVSQYLRAALRGKSVSGEAVSYPPPGARWHERSED